SVLRPHLILLCRIRMSALVILADFPGRTNLRITLSAISNTTWSLLTPDCDELDFAFYESLLLTLRLSSGNVFVVNAMLYLYQSLVRLCVTIDINHDEPSLAH